MPEIPEIETIRRQLEAHLSGKLITQVEVLREKTFNVPTEEVIGTLLDSTVTTVLRRGKILILQFDRPVTLIFHFMLEGYLQFLYPDEKMEKGYQFMLKFSTGEHLYFCKMYLGYIHIEKTAEIASVPEIAELGPDPLSPDFTYEMFHSRTTGRKKMIKPLLMEQDFLAGIGNTYSNEGLFLAGILPDRKANRLQPGETERLYHSLRDVMGRSIALGGVNDVPFSSDDRRTGGFIPELKVSYREGEPCCLCGSPIAFEKINGRNAFFCRVCQH